MIDEKNHSIQIIVVNKMLILMLLMLMNSLMTVMMDRLPCAVSFEIGPCSCSCSSK